MPKVQNHPASYRDPSGFVFLHEGKYYRQVNRCYKENYALLNESGLYDQLVKEKKNLSLILKSMKISADPVNGIAHCFPSKSPFFPGRMSGASAN